MENLIRPETYKKSFELFSVQHVLTLCVIGLLALLLVIYRRGLRTPGWKSSIRYTLAAILVISEISYQIWTISFGKWALRSSLPIQVSDLAVLLAAIMLITKSYRLFSLLYFAGIGSSIQALLTPDLGSYAFPHFRYIEFFSAHGCMILSCLYMIVVEGYRPRYQSLWFTFLILNVYGAGIFFFDWLTDANYLYLMRKPSASLLNFLGPWPWYLLSLEVVTLLIFHFLYLLLKIRPKC
ncbi:TIGR02206 family membrane protein [Sporolactobacillus pectinivorans]|uniref:YwaF family protein n=1 Tax=Sporolactobacillus pectinivorans TaxID=1591408 RepID=UPI000C25E2F0|nr:TIGR02206 family membrane protein [Sporolactobacillus pectinivorans]